MLVALAVSATAAQAHAAPPQAHPPPPTVAPTAAVPPASEPSEAERLFQIGRRAALARDYDTACLAFQSSLRLDRAPGTLLNLGDCEENRFHLADAVERFEEALAHLPPTDDRIPMVTERVRQLDRTVPRLVLRVRPDAPPGTTVAIDGVVVDRAKLDAPVRVNPGRREVTTTAVGHQGTKTIVELATRDTKELELGPGDRLEDGVPSRDSGPAGDGSRHEPGSRTLGYVLGGVGIGGLWAGSIVAALAIAKGEERSTACSGPTGCTEQGVAAERSASTLTTAAAVTLAGGAALTLAGAYLVLVPSGRPVAASVAPSAGATTAGLVVHGRF